MPNKVISLRDSLGAYVTISLGSSSARWYRPSPCTLEIHSGCLFSHFCLASIMWGARMNQRAQAIHYEIQPSSNLGVTQAQKTRSSQKARSCHQSSHSLIDPWLRADQTPSKQAIVLSYMPTFLMKLEHSFSHWKANVTGWIHKQATYSLQCSVFSSIKQEDEYMPTISQWWN